MPAVGTLHSAFMSLDVFAFAAGLQDWAVQALGTADHQLVPVAACVVDTAVLPCVRPQVGVPLSMWEISGAADA
jgi:hypothetical protein